MALFEFLSATARATIIRLYAAKWVVLVEIVVDDYRGAVFSGLPRLEPGEKSNDKSEKTVKIAGSPWNKKFLHQGKIR